MPTSTFWRTCLQATIHKCGKIPGEWRMNLWIASTELLGNLWRIHRYPLEDHSIIVWYFFVFTQMIFKSCPPQPFQPCDNVSLHLKWGAGIPSCSFPKRSWPLLSHNTLDNGIPHSIFSGGGYSHLHTPRILKESMDDTHFHYLEDVGMPTSTWRGACGHDPSTF